MEMPKKWGASAKFCKFRGFCGTFFKLRLRKCAEILTSMD